MRDDNERSHNIKTNTSEDNSFLKKTERIKRRDILKGLATVPVIGPFFYSFWKKKLLDDTRRKEILAELGLDTKIPDVFPKTTRKKPVDLIRLGIIGVGGRGDHLLRCAGFVHSSWLEAKRHEAAENKMNKELETFLNQDDMNVVLNGVCDIFDPRAERGIASSKNVLKSGRKIEQSSGAKRYRHYQELLDSKDIDAVIIATPDHWHAQMTLDAVSAGKHVYLEKCMTRTMEETLQVYDAVKKGPIVFQLGHQNRQQESHQRARLLVERNILGKITLVETTTNRNSPDGAWQYEVPEDAGSHNIDWDQFLGPTPNKVPFNVYRFFRWRCWFDYGTGLSGDLLSHEYDAVNQILQLGIPKTAAASGGIYFFKDGRDAPDVFQVTFEYPERDLTLLYSATLASNRNRGKVFMGHDASMEVGVGLTVMADSDSTRYREKYLNEMIDLSLPLFSFRPGSKGIDAVTSATEKYFASRGLLYTYKGGKRIDVAHLHVKEWLECIRNGGEPSCNIERGFEEAITCHMATQSYLEGKKVEWDPVHRRIL